jgi:hypothetical protein
MSLFQSKADKEFEKKMAIKKTMSTMNKQIDKLTESEKQYIQIAKKAKAEGLDNQLSLAVSGLKSTIASRKRVQEMLLNLQIMVQTKDMLDSTSEFLDSMGSLSKDMIKLCDAKQFANVSKEFEKAMNATQEQSERIGDFMDNSKEEFSTVSKTQDSSGIQDGEIMKLIDSEATSEAEMSNDDLNKQIDDLLKKTEKEK